MRRVEVGHARIIVHSCSIDATHTSTHTFQRTVPVRAGSNRDVDDCIELWRRVIVARDGCKVIPGVVRQRAQEAFTRPVVRFAVVGSQPKGFALTLARESGVALLSGLCVEPKLSSRGIGTTLITDAVEQAGFARIDLDVRQTNSRAINLYRRMGFVTTSNSWEYDDGDPLMSLSRDLTTVRHPERDLVQDKHAWGGD